MKRLFINYVTDNLIYDLANSCVIEDLQSLANSVQSIIVVNYPGSYTRIRKSIATAKAIAVYNHNTSLYGFSLFKYFNHYNENNFFLEKYIYWQERKVGPFSELLLSNKKYISNVQTEISDAIDCSSRALIKFIVNNDLELEDLKQIYMDKFEKINS